MKASLITISLMASASAFAAGAKAPLEGTRVRVSVPGRLELPASNCRDADQVDVEAHVEGAAVSLYSERDDDFPGSYDLVKRFIVVGKSVQEAKLEYKGGFGWRRDAFEPCTLVLR